MAFLGGGAFENNERTNDREKCSVSELALIMQTSAGAHLSSTCAWLISAMVRSVEAEISLLFQKSVQENR